MRNRLLILAAALASFIFPSVAGASVGPMRIGLVHDYSGASIIAITSDKSYVLRDSTGAIVAKGSPAEMYEIRVSGTQLTLAHVVGSAAAGRAYSLRDTLTIQPADNGMSAIVRLDSTSRPVWRHYHGIVTVRPDTDSSLSLVNTIDLEDYLYGVIPAEIGTSAPLEAMKAQAIAARTFALKNRGRFTQYGYDIDDTTRSEGYLGVDGETPQCTEAVNETRGLVLTYNGDLIEASYSTDSGGETACDTTGQYPYFQAVHDGPDSMNDYAASSATHHWTLELAPSALAERLSKDSRTTVGNFASLTIDGYDASGRITTATVHGSGGDTKTVAGPALRQIIGYDSMRSTRVKLTIASNGDYLFDGWGWGHGFGMSQLGAVDMASAPYNRNCRDILSHYYVGAALTAVDEAASSSVTVARSAF